MEVYLSLNYVSKLCIGATIIPVNELHVKLGLNRQLKANGSCKLENSWRS